MRKINRREFLYNGSAYRRRLPLRHIRSQLLEKACRRDTRDSDARKVTGRATVYREGSQGS